MNQAAQDRSVSPPKDASQGRRKTEHPVKGDAVTEIGLFLS